jgi:phage shock protein PspC (stress-responsive transcriptional regulator)
MQKVITVSLNGNAYQLDEAAYTQLAAYLNEAARALAGNPDSAEIIADLEQAIAEKCARYLSAHKNVVTGGELEQVIAQMGPVDDTHAAASGEAPASAKPEPAPGAASARAGEGSADAPRRLYQISEGALVSGVCKGLAAYFNADVTLVRVIFVVMIIFTAGLGLLAYLALMIVIPYASTSEEHAAARGLPFNARALVERAKAKYAEFASHAERHMEGAPWRHEWQRARAKWRAERRRMRDDWRAYRRSGYRQNLPPSPPAAADPAPIHYAAHFITGAMLAAMGLVLALFTVVWLLALISLIKTHAILGYALPHDMPLWVAIIILVGLYQCVAWPTHHVRQALYASAGGYYGPWAAAWNGLIALAVIAALLWYGLHHQADVRALVEHLWRWWQDILGHHVTLDT